MAIRVPLRARPLLLITALAATVAVAPTFAAATPATPATPSPQTITSVEKQLGTLALQNSQVVEKYNQAVVLVTKREKAATDASAAARQAAKAYLAARVAFAQTIQAQYESESVGTAGALFDSNSDGNYLDRLDTLNLVSSHTAQIVKTVKAAQHASSTQAAKAKSLLASATSERDALKTKRKTVEAQIAKYKSTLATLTFAAQADYLRAANPKATAAAIKAATTDLPGAGSAAARKAVQFALAQVGKPYVFGAAGPSSFDCSGLTMAAWRQGGVSLPHSAADQYNYGHHVSRDALEPGDLIFFYQPIGHVTIYIGNGLMVSAPTEGEPVAVVPLGAFNSDYVGATRLS